jgi:hypothetical protein
MNRGPWIYSTQEQSRTVRKTDLAAAVDKLHSSVVSFIGDIVFLKQNYELFRNKSAS